MVVPWIVAALGCTDKTPPDPTVPTDTAAVSDTALSTTPSTPTTPSVYVMAGFSFVDDHVAGMPQPGRFVPLEQDLAFLVEQQIALLVSLTEEPTDPLAVDAAGLDLLHLPIVDFTPPTLEQQDALVDAVRERVAVGERVGVHDTAGLGRCGTMLATWFVAEGMGADEAIAAIRALRPGSIETVEQEQAVHAYAASIAADTGARVSRGAP
jgi:atypical dual specificity phosphatase